MGATTPSTVAATTISASGTTTLSGNQIISVTDNSNAALRITQLGTGDALLVEDSSNPDSTPFVIDASGRVVLGNTSALTLAGATPGFQNHSTVSTQAAIIGWGTTSNQAPLLNLYRSASGVVGTQGAVVSGSDLGAVNFFGDDGTAFIPAAQILAEVDGTPSTSDMPGRLVFSTTADGASSPTERMRINSSGNVGIGDGGSLLGKISIGGTLTTSSSNSQVFRSVPTIPSTTTSNYRTYLSAPITQAASFTLTTLNHFSADPQTLGAGSSVTNQYGFSAESTLTGATNNYGFYGAIASGTGRYNFYAAGTAQNYFAGTVQTGSTIGVGGATPSTSGAGVTFPATQSASSDANTLDDYEEGTWTPTQGGGLTVVGAFASSGTYTKIGRQVSVIGTMTGATSIAFASAGGILTGGLPFNLATYGGGQAFNNALSAGMIITGDGGSSIYGAGTITANARISFHFTYFV